jgi:hypothetical protein
VKFYFRYKSHTHCKNYRIRIKEGSQSIALLVKKSKEKTDPDIAVHQVINYLLASPTANTSLAMGCAQK